MRRNLPFLLIFCLVLGSSLSLRADSEPFDLTGPKIDVHVKRGSVTLPISQTPNLLAGDRLWIHPDLPENQAAHFVLVVAFLRGSTNPPPPDWFTRVETWSRTARNEGVFITVPEGAQQAVLFLAPETGGDFKTLRAAVRGRPGTFVRATQDLQAASWERIRLEAYLADVKISSQYDPAELKTRTEMAARSLGIKINESCFQKPTDQQAACLSQISEGMVLDDTGSASVVSQLTSGDTMDLMNRISSTSVGGNGSYSVYIGAIVDTVRILSSLHTAHFQYIPALALPKTDTLNLRLNMAPSFRDPKSVVVVALPPVGPVRPEPLHPVNPADSFCAPKPGLVLSAEGAPLVFATQYAHDLVLHFEPNAETHGPALDLPLVANSSKGGLVPTQPIPTLPGGELTGVVRGKWGFDHWEGPHFRLVSPVSGKWTLAAADRTALVVGRDDLLHIEGQNTACVEKIEAQTAAHQMLHLTWKSPKPGALELTVPLKDATPGPVEISISQFALAKPDQLTIVAYEEAASLRRLTLHVGDKTALLQGTRLDQVAGAKIDGIALTPAVLNRVDNFDQLLMNATTSTASLASGKSYEARVELKDGRVLKTPVSIDPPRPQISLLNAGVQNDAAASPSPVQLGNTKDFPVDSQLVFFLKSEQPSNFPRDEKVEVAAEDSGFHTTLAVSDGSLMLEDAHTAVGRFKPLVRFGSSAFGSLRLRAIAADGATGDWLPLGMLVRFPSFKQLRCPKLANKPCQLIGADLFFAASFAATPAFDNPIEVPAQFTGTQLLVPHPANGTLYLKLRDDPETVHTLTLPVTPLLPAIVPAGKSSSEVGQPGAPSGESASDQHDEKAETTAAATAAAAVDATREEAKQGANTTPPSPNQK